MKTFSLKQQYVIVIIIFCLLTIFFFRYFTLRNLPFLKKSSIIEEGKRPSIAIEIGGEVEKPGIYCFEHEVNLGEVIERAGGLKRNMVLPKRCFSIEVANGAKITMGNVPSSFTMGMMEPEKRFLYFIPININTAGMNELVVVPGIGEKKALAIIRHRQEHGNFSRLDELKRVSGIGNYNFTRMKQYLTF